MDSDIDADLPRDRNGCVFIDRDPALFADVLNWLRTGVVLVRDEGHRQALALEAEHFEVCPVCPRACMH